MDFYLEVDAISGRSLLPRGSVINSSQVWLNIFDIFPRTELTVTVERESKHLVTSGLCKSCSQ